MQYKSEFIRNTPKRSQSNRDQSFTLYHKLIPLGIIFCGVWVSTQLFAFQPMYAAYVRSVTPPWFTLLGTPIYAPWNIFVWLFLLYRNNKELVQQSFIHTALLPMYISSGAGVIVYTVLALSRGLVHRNAKLHGTSRFMEDAELKRAGLRALDGIVAGQSYAAVIDTDASSGDTVYTVRKEASLVTIGEMNTLLCCPAGSGKNISTIIPTLLSYKKSVIVFDPKAENWHKTAGYRRSFSHILRMSFNDVMSISYNIIKEIRPGHLAYDDALVIAEALMSFDSAGPSKSDENTNHFRKAAQGLLTGCILHVFSCPLIKDKSIGGVLDLLSTIRVTDDAQSDGGSQFLMEMIKLPHDDPIVGDVLVEYIPKVIADVAKIQLSRADRERQSVFSTAENAIGTLWRNPLVRKNTTRHDFSFKDFATSKLPISLYITIPYANLAALGPVARLVLTLILKKISGGESYHGKKPLSYDCLAILDEWPQMGNFPFLTQCLGIIRSFGMRFLLVCQSLKQVTEIYGKDHPFLEHCKTWIFYATGDPDTAELLSKILGKKSVDKESVSTSGSKYLVGLGQMNLSVNEVEVNLMNPDEIMKLPPDTALVITRGYPPALIKKVIYWQDSRFKHKADRAVPTTREEMIETQFDPSWNYFKEINLEQEIVESAGAIASYLSPDIPTEAETSMLYPMGAEELDIETHNELVQMLPEDMIEPLHAKALAAGYYEDDDDTGGL